MSSQLFERFKSAITGFEPQPGRPVPLLPDALLLERAGDLAVYYAPFDYTNPEAKVVILGITPGLTQANNALQGARDALAAGRTDQEALKQAKRTAGFSGKMRPALIKMLDVVGLHQHLGIGTSGELFEGRADWLQTASSITFPTFHKDKDYNGTPDMTRQPVLTRLLTSHLVPIVETLRHAVFIPLGPKPLSALDWIAQHHGLKPARVLRGMPHPSGANAERIAYFLGEKPREALSKQTDPDKLDGAKREIQRVLQTG